MPRWDRVVVLGRGVHGDWRRHIDDNFSKGGFDVVAWEGSEAKAVEGRPLHAQKRAKEIVCLFSLDAEW